MQSIFAEKTVFQEKLLDASTAADIFALYPDGHSLRVAELVDAIGRAVNLEAHDRFFLQQAALVRKTGLAQMERNYVEAKRALTREERLDLNRHPVIGEQWCARNGMSRGVQLIVRWHHEWWNGSGYPDGLEGEQIPVPARILRLADTYSALTQRRHFREALSNDAARRYLIEWAGIEFDPAIVRAFLDLPEELNE